MTESAIVAARTVTSCGISTRRAALSWCRCRAGWFAACCTHRSLLLCRLVLPVIETFERTNGACSLFTAYESRHLGEQLMQQLSVADVELLVQHLAFEYC
jgi:hypothetical protein